MLLAESLLGSSSSEQVFVEDVFSTWLYTGNGSTQTITNGLDLAGKGGFVWIKSRDSLAHRLQDTTRGIGNYLNSALTSAQSGGGGVTSVSNTGFGLGNVLEYNNSGTTYASWTFRKQPKFFDVVTWTGNGFLPRVIPHNLGSVPGCIIAKRTDAVGDWYVYHRSLNGGVNPEQYWLLLNSTAATAGAGSIWDTTAPTASGFNVGAQLNTLPASGITPTYVAYVFAHDAGGFGATGTDNVISCGSFTTDGSGNATVSLGYEPQWCMLKRAVGGTGNWTILDDMRGWPVGGNDAQLQANTSGAETSASNLSDPNATGFSVTGISASSTYIYIAIRRGPMRTPTSGTSVFAPITKTGAAPTATTTEIGFQQVDAWFNSAVAGSFGGDPSYSNRISSRLTGFGLSSSAALVTSSTEAESLYAYSEIDSSGTIYDVSAGWTATKFAWYFFRRAPGFFDMVCYTGTGVARTVSHNLGVAPELMIVKSRSTSRIWAVYSSALLNTEFLRLDATDAKSSTSGTTYWNSTSPTSSVFSLGTNVAVNDSLSSNYVAYLFASCPGVSKVGSYTGTGATQTINCGFTAGARFVLIKRTDSTGDWFVWDSARGIVAGNDPYLLLNSTAAEVTNTDWVDAAASGFELSNAAGNLVNTNGASYIFLAVS